MTDVVDLILQDHEEFRRLFAELKDHPDKRATLLPVMTTLLTAHERAEESEVFPAAADAGGEHDIEHSQKEHLEADQLLADLLNTDPHSSAFESALEAAVETLTHHLEEEETTVLPGLREHLDAQKLATLGESFLATRAELLGEQPEDITKEQLVQQAENAEIDVSTTATKDELKAKLADAAEE